MTAEPLARDRSRALGAGPRLALDRRVVMVVLAVGAVVLWWGVVTNRDASHDWGGGTSTALNAAGTAGAALVLCALAAAHYLASALALKAASGARLPWRESYLNQLAAAAANRVTPGGLGGAAVNARYLTRRGVPALRAVGALAALSVVGAFADLVLLVVVVLLILVTGTWHGPALGSAGRVLSSDLAWLSGVADRHADLIVGASVLTLLVVALALRCSRPARRRVLHAVRTGLAEVSALRSRPRDLVVAASASAGTTLVLGCALVATLAVVAGPSVLAGTLPLLAAYLVGAAVGSALPVPGGVGTTDAALIGALMATGVPPGHAVPAVLVFRVVTFWAPAALGVLALPHLRRARAY